MALRLDPARLLIADNVGIGKTIEAGLIASELLSCGDAKRLCVLCSPHLCDQWQEELRDKFHIHAEVVRSSTIARLDRSTPQGRSLYEYFRHLIISIDFAKSDRHRPSTSDGLAETGRIGRFRRVAARLFSPPHDRRPSLAGIR